MSAERRGRTGGELIVEALLAHGVQRLFGVPGESFLPLLDALYDRRDRIAFVACRHEHGASMMAEAAGKLGDPPGVCVVTRGPGACNAAIGVHTAFQDSTAMLLLVGQVPRAFLGREAFQEVDLAALFRPLAKQALQIGSAAELPDAVVRALYLARTGRPGPVVLALPEDVLAEHVAAINVPPLPALQRLPDFGAMEKLRTMLGPALRPVMLLGGGGWSERARSDILAFAETNGVAVCGGFRRHDLFDNDHPCWAGELGIGANPALVARVQGADLLLAVGSRLGEATSQGYAVPGEGGPRLVHVHPDPAEPGRVFSPALAIAAGVAEFAAAARALEPAGAHARSAWVEAARADYLVDSEPAGSGTALDPGQVMAHLRQMLPAGAVVTVDAGNFAGWPQRYLRFGAGRRLLGACNGAMGYGVPAAVAAKLRHPERMVIACVGDGGFGMTGHELATAVRLGAAPIILVFDNRMYGTIRMHQERRYPGRQIGTDLGGGIGTGAEGSDGGPDYAAIARAFGAYAERVERTEEFAPAFARATSAGRAAVLHLRIDPELISTRTTLSRMRSVPA